MAPRGEMCSRCVDGAQNERERARGSVLANALGSWAHVCGCRAAAMRHVAVSAHHARLHPGH
eukprot:6642630-Prymnesium_polylepis.1